MGVGLIGAAALMVLAGLGLVGFGLPAKEFSVGSTMILAGTVLGVSGVIVGALALILAELRRIAILPAGRIEAERTAEVFAEPASAAGDGLIGALVNDRPGRSEPALELQPVSPLPPRETPARESWPPRDIVPPGPLGDMGRNEETLRPIMPDRAAERIADRAEPGDRPRPEAPAAPPRSSEGAQGRLFNTLWRQRQQEAAAQRRAATARGERDADLGAANPPPRRVSETAADTPAEAVVLKSGVVNGMAYTLFSDGSIEAELPDGVLRFSSIDELRAYLDSRG